MSEDSNPVTVETRRRMRRATTRPASHALGLRMKKPVLVVVSSVAAVADAGAQQRPLTPAMTCGEAAALVAARGHVVLGTGRFTYERVVRDASFCAITETTRPSWLPTRDNPYCLVGYHCVEAEPITADK
jgi:hypothetical protein